MHSPSHPRATLGGIVAVLLWSTTIAFSRRLTESLGTFLAPMLICLLSGSVGMALALLRPGRQAPPWRMPRRYLIVCGICFVAYQALLYSALGMAESRLQVLVVGLGNYLWPALTLVFSVWLLGRRASIGLWPGFAAATAGLVLAALSTAGGAGTQDGPGWLSGLPIYGLAVGAAVAWGLYSNFSRRFAGQAAGNAVPLFLLAAALVIAPLAVWRYTPPQWSPGVFAMLAYMGLIPTLLAYGLWDRAVRHGNIVLVASFSYVTPLLSSFISAAILGVWPRPWFWLACVLTIAGAWVCSRSVHEGPASRRVQHT